MIRLLIIPLLLLLGQPVTASDPGAETNRYELRYIYGALNAKVATATISLTPDVWEGQDVYRADVSIKVRPIFRLFLHAVYAVEGRFSRPGMQPLQYFSDTGKVVGGCDYSEGEEGVCYWRIPEKDTVKEVYTYPNDGKTMEMLSLLFFTRTYDFREGEPCQVKVILAGKPVPSIITLEGEDSERYPGYRAQILHMVMSNRGMMENGSGSDVYLWREAEGNRRILGLKVSLGKKGTMLCNIL